MVAESFPGLPCLGLTVFPLEVGRLLVGLRHHLLEGMHLYRLGSFRTLVPQMEDLRRGNQEIRLDHRILGCTWRVKLTLDTECRIMAILIE